MSQRPTIQKPTPLTAPQNASADPVMGGVNIPKFSAEMSAEISPEAAPLWNFVQNHASQIAAAVVSLVVIILAIAGWQWYVEKQLTEAKGQLGRTDKGLFFGPFGLGCKGADRDMQPATPPPDFGAQPLPIGGQYGSHLLFGHGFMDIVSPCRQRHALDCRTDPGILGAQLGISGLLCPLGGAAPQV